MAGAAAAFMGFRGPLSPPWIGVTFALVILFVVLVVLHDRVYRKMDRLARLCRVNEAATARLDHGWDDAPVPTPPAEQEETPLAGDLDLFGRASLFQLLGSVRTPPGRQTLAQWLVAPAGADEIRKRQGAVAELASLVDLRQDLETTALDMSERPPDVGPFLEWAEGPAWLRHRPLIVWVSRLLPAATITLIVLQATGVVPTHFWALPAIAALVMTRQLSSKIHHVFDRVSSRGERVTPYVALFRTLSEASVESPRMQEIQRRLEVDGLAAHRQMKRFARIMEMADLRFSGMFHLPMVALTMWDFHVLLALESWQEHAGRHVRAWLDALGEAEALAALSGMSFDNPDWCFPEISDDAPRQLTAEALGHPLIHPDLRVTNDVTVGPVGSFLLVTGSNMSGKTTLLRSLGVAAVVGQAGGVVCARSLAMPPLIVGTSIRIRDSLEEGVSFFMAEVQRIKQVVDLAGGSDEGRTLLFLLDEILQGTNSAERQVAVTGVVERLVEAGALGAISTHDLALGEVEALGESSHAVHFTESIHEGDDGPKMTFDYVLREGVATSTNALKLLEMVGVR